MRNILVMSALVAVFIGLWSCAQPSLTQMMGSVGGLAHIDAEGQYSIQYPLGSQFLKASIPENPVTTSAINVFLPVKNCPQSGRLMISARKQRTTKRVAHDFVPDSVTDIRTVTIAGVEALRSDNGHLAGRPIVWIPNGDLVLQIDLSAIGRSIPPYDPPCVESLEMFEQVLTSLKLGVNQ